MATYSAVSTGAGHKFTIELFEIGETSACLYSWFCTPCAIAQSRTYLDGSSCILNFFCLCPTSARWLARSAYGIGDTTSCWEDCLLTASLPCCATNQLYQTTAYLKYPATNVGSKFNTNIMAPTDKQWTLTSALYNCFCMPCAIGDSLNRAMAMPWCLGCCCMPLCSARNVLRYHHRVHTTLHEETAILWTAGYCNAELFEECCLISVATGFGYCIDQWVLGLGTLLFWPLQMLVVSQIVAESETGRAGPGYLVGYRSNNNYDAATPSVSSSVGEYVAPLIVKGMVDKGDTMELRFNEM